MKLKQLAVVVLKTHLIKGFPYVESTSLDNGKPGSTWRNCMQAKGFTVDG